MSDMKYSDLLADWLKKLGYTRCFFLPGGNVMHLIESMSRCFVCTSVVHEVAAGIAVEYFNEVSPKGKAFALVTAGPGLTNIITAMAGAYLESRELLVIGGQVKTTDLSRGAVRQRGIQEIDGVRLAEPVTVRSALLDRIVNFDEFSNIVKSGTHARKGPVFIEIPLDIQARSVDPELCGVGCDQDNVSCQAELDERTVKRLVAEFQRSQRPMLLIGGGVSRDVAARIYARFEHSSVPIATTWNGADRIGADHPNYCGRPNTWGQRYSNILLQQADLLVALGTRLGIQQTGFNWQAFVPGGKVVQVDCDDKELNKGHPKLWWALKADADTILEKLLAADLGDHNGWLAFCRMVKAELPLVESCNKTGPDYLSPYMFVDKLSDLCSPSDIVIPCSSGGAFTVTYQAFRQKYGQQIITDKGLASMGYGLSGAIGAACANPGRRVILLEGDGGFAQNLQEIGTAAINRLNLKMFIYDDGGYASIRMTQKSYFGGRYIGCDRITGVGLPDWEKLFTVYDVPVIRLRPGFESVPEFQHLFDQDGPAAFIVTLDPNQTYFPKITSRVTQDGSMESNPLHLMTPPLPNSVYARVAPFLVGLAADSVVG